jgi:hypothetical protein
LLTKIVTDEQLINLYTEDGYLVAVDFPKREIKLHTIDCMLADPISSIGVKPTKGNKENTGEFWYSKNRETANKKAEEIVKAKGYTYIVCPICNR